MEDDPSDADIEQQLRSISLEQWEQFWIAADALLADDRPYEWRDTGAWYSETVTRFLQQLYQSGLMVIFDWPAWRDGRERYRDAGAIESAPIADVMRILTAIVRQDRFVEGLLASALDSGRLAAIVTRLRRWQTASPQT